MGKDKKAKSSYVKIANGFGKQRIITWISYAAIVALSVLASAYELLFNFEQFDATKFATKLSISLSIAILSLLMAIKDGQTTNESKRFGDYFDTKQKFAKKLESIVNRDWFRQWCDGPLYERERKSAVDAILNEYGITECEYLNVSDEDLEALQKEPKICDVGKSENGEPITKPLDVITKNQAKLIRVVRDNYRFKKLDYSYFISLSVGGGYSYYANLKDNQRKRKIFAIVYRIFAILLMTSILALAVINPHGESIEQVAFDTTGRISTLLSSVYMGYTLANDEMKENIDAMLFKMEKVDQYIVEKDSGAFVPISKDEEVKAKIEAIEKARAEEAKKAAESVVEPTVVDVVQAAPTQIEYREIEMTEDEFNAFRN